MTLVGSVSVRPLTTNVGAEIYGVDLRHSLDDAAVAEIRRALLDHCVVFFRDQDITPRQQLDFAQRFGRVVVPAFTNTATEVSGVVEMATLTGMVDKKGTTDNWHADSTLLSEPPLGAILRAVRLPTVGGDTCFASMYAAYEGLSRPMQAFLDGLTAVHSMTAAQRVMDRSKTSLIEPEKREAIHPIVRIHPETGRKLLYVNSIYTERIVELEPDESTAVLSLLIEHIKSPAFQCRYRWEVNSVAFWDNRSAQHYAVADYDEERVMHRVLLSGGQPVHP